MAIDSVIGSAKIAEDLSVAQLQQAIQSGSIPPYIGIPMLEQKVQMEQRMRNASAQTQQGQPSIAEEVMAKAEGLNQLQSNLPEQYAGGGIVAFARGGIPDIEADQFDEDSEDEMNDEIRKVLRQMQSVRDMASRYSEEVATPPEVSTLTSSSNIPGFTSTEVKKGVSVKEGDQPARTVEERQKSVTKPAGLEELLDLVKQKESGDRRFDKSGNVLTSPKGAMGEMQVMPMTARDPGFGIRPAREGDLDDLARVGREYYTKMLEKYGDPKLAAIAYNMGPGATDKWLMAGADPSRLPDETRKYAQGFAEGGIASFRNGGSFSEDEDYLTIPGLESDDLYARAMRRAKGIPEPKQPGYRPGKMPPDFGMRIAGEDLFNVENLEPGTLFADAMRSVQSQPAQPAQAAQPTRTQLAPINPARNNPMSVTGPGDLRWGRDLGRDRINPTGPAATPNMMGRIETLGAQLDQARSEVDALMKAQPGLRQRAAAPEWQQKYDEAVARKNSLQNQYEKLMESTGMNQAAFGVFGGALSPTRREPNPMVQAMGAQQPLIKPSLSTVNRQASDRISNALPMSVQDPFGYEDQGIGALVPEYSDSDMAERADRMTGGITPEAVAKAAEIAPESEFLKRLQDRITKGYAKLDKQEETDKYLALLSAGLGIMSGTSPFALSNIGRGGMMGVQSLMQSDASRAAQEAKLMNAELLAERIKTYGETAAEARKSREETAKLLEQGRINRAQDVAQARADRLAETKRQNNIQGMEDLKKLYQVKALKQLGTAFTDAQKEAVLAQADLDLLNDATYRDLYKQTYGRDPLSLTSGWSIKPLKPVK